MIQYLLDTNALSEPAKPQPNTGFAGWLQSVDELSLFTSCLALGELQKGVSLVTNNSKRKQLNSWLNKLAAGFDGRVIGVDENTGLLWGTLLAAGQLNGTVAPVIDSLIAAQCLQHQLVLVTRNAKDFGNFVGLQVLNPWS